MKGISEIFSNYFKNKTQGVPEILPNYFKNKKRDLQDSSKKSPTFFQFTPKTGPTGLHENNIVSWNISNYFKNQTQGVPKILSNYFKNQAEFKILSNYFKNKTQGVYQIFQITSKTRPSRGPCDPFNLLQKQNKSSPRDSFELLLQK